MEIQTFFRNFVKTHRKKKYSSSTIFPKMYFVQDNPILYRPVEDMLKQMEGAGVTLFK